MTCPAFSAVGAASHEIRPEALMTVFASFNGGPTEQAVQLAILSSALAGVIVGGIIRRPGMACLVGLLSGVIVCGALLLGGNRSGDAADLFLVGSLIIFCPLCGLLSGAAAAMSGWVAGKLLKPGHEPTKEGAISRTGAGPLSTEAEPHAAPNVSSLSPNSGQ
jgi:hypothetical protein